MEKGCLLMTKLTFNNTYGEKLNIDEMAAIGKALVEGFNQASEWQITVNLYDHKRRLVATDETRKEIFELIFNGTIGG
jgi:hypothetical protein